MRVSGIDNPEEVLENFKAAVIACLANINLNEKDEKWRQLMPAKIISFVDRLDLKDFSNDDFAMPLWLLIHDMRKLKRWEWYSSKLTSDGFDMIVTGNFLAKFVWFVHCQNIPLSKIAIESGGIVYIR